MSGKSILIIVAAAGAALLLFKGEAFGASGGAGPGDTKKSTVISGITPPIPDGSIPSGEGPTTYTSPAPYSPPNTWSNINNPNPNEAPFIPSPYLMDLMTKKQMAVEQLESSGLTDIKFVGTDKYTGYRSGYYIEGDLTSKKLEIDPITKQAFTRDTGGWGDSKAVLYTEKSRQDPTFTGHTRGIGYGGGSSPSSKKEAFKGRQSEYNTAPTYSSGKYGGWGG